MAVISAIIIVGLKKKIFENLLTNLPSNYLSMQLHHDFYYLLVKVFTRLTFRAFLEIREDITSHFKNQ